VIGDDNKPFLATEANGQRPQAALEAPEMPSRRHPPAHPEEPAHDVIIRPRALGPLRDHERADPGHRDRHQAAVQVRQVGDGSLAGTEYRIPDVTSEVGVGQVAGRASKISGLFAGIRRDHLLGLLWFDVAQHSGLYHQDWRLEGGPAAVAAFRRALASMRKRRARHTRPDAGQAMAAPQRKR
jgi:hypothetical protein